METYHYNSARVRIAPRTQFDPANKKHRDIYTHFLKHKSWPGDLNFYLEWPYDSIPSMCQDRIARYFLKVPLSDYRKDM